MNIQFEYPVYPDLTRLPKEKRAYACWYYYTLAMKLSEFLGNGTAEAQFGVLEGEPWLGPEYEQIARTVAMMYGFKDPSEFMQERFWDVVETQAIELGLPRPHYRIKYPVRIALVS